MLGLVLDVCLDAQGHGMEMLDVVFCLLWRTDLLSRLGGGKAIVMMTWFGVSYFFFISVLLFCGRLASHESWIAIFISTECRSRY